jgi:hypothetical protein
MIPSQTDRGRVSRRDPPEASGVSPIVFSRGISFDIPRDQVRHRVSSIRPL